MIRETSILEAEGAEWYEKQAYRERGGIMVRETSIFVGRGKRMVIYCKPFL
jgi:hypothetical protein